MDPKMSILGTAWRAESPLEILSGTVERAADLFNSTRDPKEPPRTPKVPAIDLKGLLRNPKGAQGPSKVSLRDPQGTHKGSTRDATGLPRDPQETTEDLHGTQKGTRGCGVFPSAL